MPYATTQPSSLPRLQHGLHREDQPGLAMAGAIPRNLLRSVRRSPERFRQYLWFQAGYPVGTALLEASGERSWELEWFLVDRRLRRKGIGTEFFHALLAELRSAGAVQLAANWTDRLRAEPAWRALLRTSPMPADIEPRVQRFTGLAGPTLRAFSRRDKLFRRMQREGMQLRPFHEVTEREAAAIEAAVEGGEIEATMSPWAFAPEPDPIVSLAIRDAGNLVGWITAKGEAEGDTWQLVYGTGYVAPAYQRRAWLVAGVAEALRCQVEAYGEQSLAIVYSPVDSAMARIYEQHVGVMEPGAGTIATRYLATFNLKSNLNSAPRDESSAERTAIHSTG